MEDKQHVHYETEVNHAIDEEETFDAVRIFDESNLIRGHDCGEHSRKEHGDVPGWHPLRTARIDRARIPLVLFEKLHAEPVRLERNATSRGYRNGFARYAVTDVPHVFQ